MSHDCCVALPHDAKDLSAVCDCGISGSYSLTIPNFCNVSSQINNLIKLTRYEESEHRADDSHNYSQS